MIASNPLYTIGNFSVNVIGKYENIEYYYNEINKYYKSQLICHYWFF